MEKNTTVYYVVSSGVTDVTVPEVAGLLLSDVQSACDKVGIKYNVKYTTNPTWKAIMSYANPEAGSTVKAGDTIELWVSQPADGDTSSATTQTLKNYTGQSVIDAQSGLEAAGYVVQITEQVSADIPAGTVISQKSDRRNPGSGKYRHPDRQRGSRRSGRIRKRNQLRNDEYHVLRGRHRGRKHNRRVLL